MDEPSSWLVHLKREEKISSEDDSCELAERERRGIGPALRRPERVSIREKKRREEGNLLLFEMLGTHMGDLLPH